MKWLPPKGCTFQLWVRISTYAYSVPNNGVLFIVELSVFHVLYIQVLLWSECLCPPHPHKEKSTCQTLLTNVKVSAGGAFRGQLCHKSRALTNGSSALIKEPKELTCSFCHVSTQWKDIHLWNKVDPHQTWNLPAPSSWIFQPQELWHISVVDKPFSYGIPYSKRTQTSHLSDMLFINIIPFL